MLIALTALALLFTAYFSMTFYLALRGSNYLRTPDTVIAKVVQAIPKDAKFIDLGFGNGGVLLATAQKASTSIGYELDFLRYLFAAYRVIRSRKTGISLRYNSIWEADVHTADVVYTFFTSLHMQELYRKLSAEMKPGSLFISYVHKVPLIKPEKTQGKLSFYRM